MNTKYEFLGASALLLIIAGLAVVLVIGVRANLEEIDPPPPPPTDPDLVEVEAAVALPPFPAHIDIFDEPWKPEPTPTPLLLPTPTPTEPPFAVWDVILIIGNAVQIRDIRGGLHYLGEDETFEGCRVIKVDWEENEILVRNDSDGRVKTLKRENQ
jgi:hypothetical protein